MKPTLDRTPTAEAIEQSRKLGCAFLMLGHGKFALLDHADIPNAAAWTWHWNKRGYAARLQYRGPGKSDAIIYLHRFLVNDIKGVTYDHINRNKLDCRRSNLRIADKHQNAGNIAKRKHKRETTSAFKGVSFDRSKQRWQAQGSAFGRCVFIGRFRDETDAARAYNAWASQHFREFAFLNPV